MPSPFPGMDPYLEPHWPDVHGTLIHLSKSELNRRLPEDLVARSEEQVAIGDGGEDFETIKPDVRVVEDSDLETDQPYRPTATGRNGAAVALAPLRLRDPADLKKERYVEVIDPHNYERAITVIEFLSPANKVGDGLVALREKRDRLLAGGVNFVVVDLVRAGDWRRVIAPRVMFRSQVTTYRALLYIPQRIQGNRPGAYLHPMPIRDPLPTINIPLRPDDRPAELPLQPLIDAAYENGRYGRTLRRFYREPLDPPLGADDAAWAAERVRAWEASG